MFETRNTMPPAPSGGTRRGLRHLPSSRALAQRGLAALEVALMLPVIAALLYVLVEGGNTIRAYSALTEASRTGARHVVMNDDVAGVQPFVRSLATTLDPNALTATAVKDTGKQMVTVTVKYAYKSVFTSNPYNGDPHDALYTFSASTSMPTP